MRRWRLGGALIALATTAMVLLLRQGGALDRLENQASDARFSLLQRDVSSDIVIVGIDARSLGELRSWPWPRRQHAELLQRLRAASPRQVFLDIDFSSRSNATDDTALADALAEWRDTPVLLPEFFQSAAGNDPGLLRTQPLRDFARHTRLATVNQQLDADGVVRRFRLDWRVAGQQIPSAASLLAAQRATTDRPLLIDYSIAPASFAYLSYVQVLRGEFDQSQLAGKTVIVGATASELNDMLSVPLHRALAGPVVQALATQTLLIGPLRTLPDSFYLLTLPVWAGLLVLALSFGGWRATAPTTAAAIVAPFLATLWLQSALRISMEIVPWSLVACGCFIAVTVRSLDRETLRSIAYALGLRRREALMVSVVESSTDGILCVDQHGSIRSANSASARLFDSEAGTLVGSDLATFLHLHDRSMLRLPLLTDGQNEGEVRTSTGRALPVEFSVSPVQLQDEPLFTVIVRDIRDRKAQELKLQYQAKHDPLTTLPNRAAMGDYLDRALTTARHGDRVALLMIDLCRFKEINDTLGHNVGDLVLQEVADRFRRAIADRGFLARIGGDEFTVVVDRGATDADVGKLTQALDEAMRAPIEANGIGMDLGVSIGIAWFPEHAGDAQSLLKNADVAMYVAKRRGAVSEVYDSAHDQHSVRKLMMAAELRSAIAQQGLRLHFQPQVNLRTGRVESAEALLRWQHATLGDVSPVEFIAIAESTDLIQPLTHWTLREALRQSAAWRTSGLELRLAVNISARVLQDVNFADRLQAMLNEFGVPPVLLELEITESAMMSDPARALSVVEKIHAVGVMVSIDDYGTGFSSLAYLRDLPIHALKLDKSFVLTMHERETNRAIVESTAQLAHALRLHVVAEGVETEEQARTLARMGYDYGQGYRYTRALTAAALADWMRGFNGERGTYWAERDADVDAVEGQRARA